MITDGDGLTAECGHAGPGTPPAVCGHLRGDSVYPWGSYRCYTGIGLEYLLLCRECAERFDGGRQTTALLCADCLERITSDLGEAIGVRGRPEVLLRPGSPDIVPTTLPYLDVSASNLIDVAADGSGQWFGLCADGTILAVGQGWRSATVLIAVAPRAEPCQDNPPTRPIRRRLHVSPSGRFAAVVDDYGRHGVVVDLSTGRTMDLDGGDGHPWTVPFSLAFAVHQGREVVVHRTAWNRLDVTDLESARLLTARGPTTSGPGEERSVHYLDYYHGGLYLSPDGRTLLDDGWVWHPIGIPVVWDLQAWLEDNVWESEDGATRLQLASRYYYWDHGMCWIDARRVAVQGIGSDDDHMVGGVRIFEVARPIVTETQAFAGPSGDIFSDGRRLFSSAEDGLSVWDLATGQRTAYGPGFRPRRFCPASGELVEVRDGNVSVWSCR